MPPHLAAQLISGKTHFRYQASCRIVPPGCSADIIDIEVKQPARVWHARKLGEHAAEGLPDHRKEFIDAVRFVCGGDPLPAEKLAVKWKNPASVFSQQFVPAHAPGLVR